LLLDRESWRGVIEGVAAGSVSRDDLVAHFTREMGGDPIALE
jgi:hypothetical protein